MADESWLHKTAKIFQGKMPPKEPELPLYGEMVSSLKPCGFDPETGKPIRTSDFQPHRKPAIESDEEKEKRWKKEYQEWVSRNRNLLQKFLEIADRKVSVLDEYGDESWHVVPREIHTFLLKIVRADRLDSAERNLKEALRKDDYSKVRAYYKVWASLLEDEFRKFHRNRASQTNTTEFTSLSGTDFEVYLGRLLKQNGFGDIRGTPATGDQGPDIIAKKDDKTIVIQAKRYQGSVGNKAVQEVVAAVKFYRADEGWVITSGTFTPSAKSLAQANNVKLIDGYALRKACFD
jgi:restriction system protein